MNAPKTEYVKKRLSRTKWKDRDYIEDLMDIERWILKFNERPTGMSHAMKMHNWCNAKQFDGIYLREYEQILKELKPKKYEKYIAEKKQYVADCKKANEKWKRDEKERIKKEKLEWKKLGGK
ncbi:MAG: hypothetical protein PHU63_04570 [Candidatus ainarchaeum sp.]|nr:hypothetical protein [Candidatus ainarchaeum sp.]